MSENYEELQDTIAELRKAEAELESLRAETKILKKTVEFIATLQQQLRDEQAAREQAEANSKLDRYKLDILAKQYIELENRLTHENKLLRQALHNANETEEYYAWMPGEENNLNGLAEDLPVRISSTWLKELISEAREQVAALVANEIRFGERLRTLRRCAYLLQNLYDRNMQISRFMGLKEEKDVHDALAALEVKGE